MSDILWIMLGLWVLLISHNVDRGFVVRRAGTSNKRVKSDLGVAQFLIGMLLLYVAALCIKIGTVGL